MQPTPSENAPVSDTPSAAVKGRNTELGIESDNTAVLIDGSGYIFRAYYAIRRLSTSDGRATNAVFGFTQMLLKTLKDVAPRYLAIAFDPKGKNFRHDMYPEYKANRPPAPEDLPPQIPLIHEVVDAFQITRVSPPGYEADDVLGTLARRLKAEGMKVVIVTGDKDLMQLVDDDVSLLDELRMQRGGDKNKLVRADEVVEKFGVPPERVVDVLALCGDASDNVPGVKGIGQKTAAELVNTYGSLEDILAAAPGLKQKARRERLLEGTEMARLSHRLVTIDTDADVDLTLDQLRYAGPDRKRLRNLFQELEFKRLLHDPLVVGTDDPGASLAAGLGTAESTGGGESAAFSPWNTGDYGEITSAEDLAGLEGELATASRIAVQVQAERRDALEGKLTGIALAWGCSKAAYLPIGHDKEIVPEQLALEVVRERLGPILAASDKEVICHNAKESVLALEAAGFPPMRVHGDPMLADYLLRVDERSHDLPGLTRVHLDHVMQDRADFLGKGKNAKALSSLPTDRAASFVGEFADASLRLDGVLTPKVHEWELDSIYREMELPLTRVLAHMERHGVKVDVAHLRSLSDEFDVELRRLEEQAYASAGGDFNLASPQQVAEVLFEKLQLPASKKTKTGYSTDASVLEELTAKHELPGLILEHRQLAKLKSTYVDVLPTLVHPLTGRVHTTFNQAVAATGRLSCQDPNLQNIPIRTSIGRRIREAFIAEPGHVIASLDYSQIELRILAHVTEDPVLIDTFRKDEDVHARTASEIFDTFLAMVSREQRTAAKSINFGLLYGMGVLRLARELGIARREAKAYLEKYFTRFAGVRQWQNTALETAKELGEVRTLFGRRRLLPQLSSSNRGEVARAERLATNTPIQGSAADLIKRAMIVAERELSEKVPSARMILQVHDELLLEVPEADAEQACDVVRDAMQNAAELRVPLKVDSAWASNWADAH